MTREQVTKAAEKKKREEPETWRHTEFSDKVHMRKDLESIQSFSISKFGKKSLYFPTRCRDPIGVVEEEGEEHVSTLRNFLETPQAEVNVVFISGHGLSERPQEWGDTWNFSNCRADTSGLPDEVKDSLRASQGNIHVFSCGLLSPYWLNECLQTREKKRVKSTVVLILDSCYSGSWIKVLDEQLKGNRLNYTKLIIQASCKSDQVAKRDFFCSALD